MVRRGLPRVRKNLVALTAVSVALFAATAGPSSAQVTEVTGSAMGASASVSLFGGPPIVLAPTATVTLPPTGGNESNSVPSIAFQTGPARLLETGAVNVSTQGTTGPGGSVTSSSSLANVLIGGFEATEVSSTCTASEAGASGSTTITGGRYVTQDPDIDVEGDEVFADLPANPAPNTSLTGVVPGVGDTYTVVLNEQTAAAGSITVTAAHFTLMGPNATGETILGQSVCGVTAGGTTPTTVDGGTPTTVDGGTPTTVDGGTPTTVDGQPIVTTTQPAPVVTTTACPTPCPVQPTTTLRVGALVRTGSDSDLTIAWAALALTMGGLLLMGSKGVPGKKS